MKIVLKNRNFQLLFAGNLVSQIGQAFFAFAIGWYILTLTQSPFQAGLYIAVKGFLQVLFVPFLSVYADRWHKGRILFGTDLIRGIVILLGGFFIFQFSDVTSILYVLYATAFVMALCHALFTPAAMAIVPEIVGDDYLREAMSLNSFINSIQQLVGVLLAGVLYALIGIVGIFIVTGVSFILSAISELFIRLNHQKSESPATFKAYQKDLSFGVSYLLKTPGLTTMLALIILLNFSIAPVFSNIYPYVFNLLLERDPVELSIVSSMLSVGMLIGGITVGTMSQKYSIKQAMKGGMFVTLLIIMLHHFWLVLGVEAHLSYALFYGGFLTIIFFFGLVNMWVNIPFNTGLTQAIDPAVRGRVMGLISTLAQGLIPISIFVTGFFLEVTSIRIVLLVLTAIGMAPFILFLTSKPVNQLLESLKEKPVAKATE